MTEFNVQPDIDHIGNVAASLTIDALGSAIQNNNSATWVLAGGTAPMTAYKIIAADYNDAIDWSKVTVIIGDERCAPLDSSDSNWHQIVPILFSTLPIPTANQHRPKSDLSAEDAAVDYATTIAQLPKTKNGMPRLDVAWLGVGEDGHTLSIFPNHPSLQPTQQLVIPVYDSPKPPADRISLTLHSLENVKTCIIMTAGAGKAMAMQKVKQNDANAPIVQAIQTIENNGGNVTLLTDSAAFGSAD